MNMKPHAPLLLFIAFITTAVAKAQQGTTAKQLPAKGDGSFAGGIFSISLTQLAKETSRNPRLFGSGTGAQSPHSKSNAVTRGTGPYPARWLVDPGLPNHVIYAPITPPTSSGGGGAIKMPVVTWGNGACRTNGTGFANFLTNLASYGYLVVANGTPQGMARQSKVSDVRDAIDWVVRGGGAKYGNVDTGRIAAAGQSCGGLEAYSVSYHDARVKLTMLFNIGIFNDNQRYLLKELKSPVGYFLGGKSDTGFLNGEKDYSLLPEGLPAFKASLDTGHMGTYFAADGGKFGKAAVAFLQWQFRDDAKSKEFLTSKGAGSLASENWSNVALKNFR